MDVFLKSAAGVLVAVVIGLVLSKHSKDFSILLVICVCCMVIAVAIGYMEKVFSFVEVIKDSGNLNGDMISLLFKSVAIGLLSEVINLICADSGNAALGKAVQILSTATILWLCIPIFTELLELVEEVLCAI